MMNELVKKHCLPCQGGTPPLKGGALKVMHASLGGIWKVIDEHHLEKEYLFKNFKEALAFTNKIGAIAEKESHHPDIYLAWGLVRLTIWTHKINGLSENDFILAAKADAVIFS